MRVTSNFNFTVVFPAVFSVDRIKWFPAYPCQAASCVNGMTSLPSVVVFLSVILVCSAGGSLLLSAPPSPLPLACKSVLGFLAVSGDSSPPWLAVLPINWQLFFRCLFPGPSSCLLYSVRINSYRLQSSMVQYSLRKIPYPKSQHFKRLNTVRFSSTHQILDLQPWSKRTRFVRQIHPRFKITVNLLPVQQMTARCLPARSTSFWYQNDAIGTCSV